MSSRLSSNHLLISALAKRQRTKNPLQAGFTLVELLIVVIIIGILSAIAIPAFLNQQEKARAKAADTTAMSSARACAALQVTAEEGQFEAPAGVTPTTCAASGNIQTYTTEIGTFPNLSRQAIATIASSGAVSLTQTASP